MNMFKTSARYALVLAFALGAIHFDGASARAEKCNAATLHDPGEFLPSPSLSTGPPEAVGRMRDRMLTMTMGGVSVVRFSVAPYFTDPDGEWLSYSAVSSNPSVAGVEMCGSILKISAVSADTATVTVTASDEPGSDVEQRFCVRVGGNCPPRSNQAPMANGPIPEKTFTRATSPISFMGSRHPGNIPCVSRPLTCQADYILLFSMEEEKHLRSLYCS